MPAHLLTCFSLFVTPWTVASQAPLHGLVQARILEWVAFPFPGDLPNPGMEPASLMSPALADGFFTTSTTTETKETDGLVLKFGSFSN